VHHPNRRSSHRIPGEGFSARIDDFDHPATVVNLSRMGIALETPEPLPSGRPLVLELEGPGGIDRVSFYVVRCESFQSSSGTPAYLTAGLFVEKLRRRDLPKVVHEDL
jgi:hypothetical protein